ncbi:hypothetical protein NQ314_005818 [Rhamnusium bicolor]|uniref:Uncharacterized protein n=1 Tax=Rhamnusium bicolor TaxID=1586634 RepID=A0AAV8ZDL6_9CUCU|nr:hypothetical protein NQ314_005818 [Rhamnusium bicolor]
MNDSLRVLNLALSFNAFAAHSSLFIPLCTGSKGWRQPGPKRDFCHTIYDHKLPYHSSAILASALETFTMKYRLKSSHFTMMDLCVDLSRYGRKAAAASLCLPFSFNSDADLLECLDNWQGPLSQSITPNCKIGTDKLIQYITLRGISDEKLKRPNQTEKLRNTPAYKCDTITDMLNLYLSYATNATSNVTVVSKPLDVKPPYPNIFDKFINQNGYVSAEQRPEHVNVGNVPILAGLHNGSGVGDMLESLHTEARRIRFNKLNQFMSGTIEKDEFEDCLDNLFRFRENYTDGYFL